MNVIAGAAASVALVAAIAGGVVTMDTRHVSTQAWEVQERQTLEYRIDMVRTEIARATNPRELGRLESVEVRLLRELCAKYPESYLC
jgi:hypothetical protein